MVKDYAGLADYLGKSERTMRRMEKNEPMRFELFYNEYLSSQNRGNDGNGYEVIAALTFKGGVAKSTILDALAYFLEDSVIINTDLTQNNAGRFASTAYDYLDVMDEKTLTEFVEDLGKKYRYVLIDSPASPNKFTFEAAELVDKVILPARPGMKDLDGLMTTLETLYGPDTRLTPKNVDLYFVISLYLDKSHRDDFYELFKNELNALQLHPQFHFNLGAGSLPISKAVYAADKKQISPIEMIRENPGAYASLTGMFTQLCRQISDHFKLEEGDKHDEDD